MIDGVTCPHWEECAILLVRSQLSTDSTKNSTIVGSLGAVKLTAEVPRDIDESSGAASRTQRPEPCGGLEIQPTGSRGISQRRDTSMITVLSAVEDDVFDALADRPLGNQLSNQFCCCLIAAVTPVAQNTFLGSAR